jgi:ATPase complex subunit ATP10
LVKAEKATHVPDIPATTLSGRRVSIRDVLSGRVSLLTACFVQFGQKHVDSYTQHLLSQVQHVELNIQENVLKRGIVYMSLPYMRHTIPKHHHDTYLLCLRNMGDFKRRMGISNTYIGWAFLVDHEQRVRWSAHGPATLKELDALGKLSGVLHDRQQQLQELKNKN